MIKPFVLRRTKSQVATELPPKSEQVFYCTMGEEQAEYYERVKSEYRNAILENIGDVNKPLQIELLLGLTKLRQLAHHPAMIDAAFRGESVKFESAARKSTSMNSSHYYASRMPSSTLETN